jgi:NAD(P)-dependent dehydrogenase (short-subunit alcohol dehydrogenase family)
VGAKLSGRVALVLGAGSVGPGWGNGKACAFAYAREGAQLVAVDLHVERAERTVEEIRAEHPHADCLPLAADVTKSVDLERIVTATLARFGRIDILHYNVGEGTFGGISDLTEPQWDTIFALNMKGAFLACKHVLPILERQGRGVVTVISSIASLGIGAYPYIAYQASKAALNHFTRGIAVTYAAKGIRANAILPGLMDTPVIYQHEQIVREHGGMDAMRRKRDALSPTGRMGSAWDVANAAVFLASDDAAYVNGVLLPVDGGLSCRLTA